MKILKLIINCNSRKSHLMSTRIHLIISQAIVKGKYHITWSKEKRWIDEPGSSSGGRGYSKLMLMWTSPGHPGHSSHRPLSSPHDNADTTTTHWCDRLIMTNAEPDMHMYDRRDAGDQTMRTMYDKIRVCHRYGQNI